MLLHLLIGTGLMRWLDRFKEDTLGEDSIKVVDNLDLVVLFLLREAGRKVKVEIKVGSTRQYLPAENLERLLMEAVRLVWREQKQLQ